MTRRGYIILLTVVLSFFSGGAMVIGYSKVFKGSISIWDHTGRSAWPKEFTIVHINSSIDDTVQSAYFFSAEGKVKRPLLLSLHTWSGDYQQQDPLAAIAKEKNWNYIHPDFRGPNNTRDACMSQKVISDIDDAIQYAVENGVVDLRNIFVVGTSGGGHATLGTYLKTSHDVKAFIAWCPITDLESWYFQSKFNHRKYSEDLQKVSSTGSAVDLQELNKRSPLYFEIPPAIKGRLEIYAGINDGHSGSVPISHSIMFFNKMARHFNRPDLVVEEPEMSNLLTRGINAPNEEALIEGRAVLHSRNSERLRLVIFDGGHEMLPSYCFSRLEELAASI